VRKSFEQRGLLCGHRRIGVLVGGQFFWHGESPMRQPARGSAVL
jgi:hypothetical protein